MVQSLLGLLAGRGHCQCFLLLSGTLHETHVREAPVWEEGRGGYAFESPTPLVFVDVYVVDPHERRLGQVWRRRELSM